MQGVGFEPSQSYDYLNLGHPANLALVEKAATRPIAVSEVWGCSSVVERSIRIRDARGSIPLISISFFDPCWRRLVAEAQKKGLTAVGFEPTPRKTGA